MIDNTFLQEALPSKKVFTDTTDYLPEQYDQSKQFPNIQEYHFRIQCDEQIRALSNLYSNSLPTTLPLTFTNSSQAFKTKLNSMIFQIDKHSVVFQNQHKLQTHSFYSLKNTPIDPPYLIPQSTPQSTSQFIIPFNNCKTELKTTEPALKTNKQKIQVEQLRQKRNKLSFSCIDI